MTAQATYRTLWALGCGALLGVAGCSGSPSADDPTPEQVAEVPATAAGTSAPPAAEPSPSADEASAPSAPTATALCEYLTGQLPDLRAIGSEVGAMANLTLGLFSWYDEQGALPVGTELDALTQEQCPEVGAEVLRLAGVESFTAL